MRVYAVIMYVFMLAFDLTVLGATAWLIVEHEWSKWWMAFALLICAGSAPSSIIKRLTTKEKE